MKFSEDNLMEGVFERDGAEEAGRPEKRARTEVGPSVAPDSSGAAPRAAAPTSVPTRTRSREHSAADASGSKREGRADTRPAAPPPAVMPAAPSTAAPSAASGDPATAAAAGPVATPPPGDAVVRPATDSHAPPPVLPASASLIREQGLAVQVMEFASTPRDRRLRGGRAVADALLGVIPQLFTIGTDVLLLRNYLASSEKREAEKEEKLRLLAADVKDLTERGLEQRNNILGLQVDLSRAETRNKELETAVSEEKASGQRRAEEEKRLVARLRSLEGQLADAQRELKAAKDRGSFADGLLKACQAELAAAVPKFRSSPDYVAEMREAAVDSFLKGFQRCRGMVSSLFPDLDITGLVLRRKEPEPSREAAAEEGPATETPATEEGEVAVPEQAPPGDGGASEPGL